MKTITKVNLDNKNMLSISYKEDTEEHQVKTKIDKDTADSIRYHLNEIGSLFDKYQDGDKSKRNLFTKLKTEYLSTNQTPTKEPEFKALP